MEPRLVSLIEINVVGIEIRTNNQQEVDPAKAKIPGLWKRFFEEAIAGKTPGVLRAGTTFAVYTKYQSDNRGEYSLILSSQVKTLKSIPAGMIGMAIPPARYLVFTAKGKMPDAVIKTWPSIWKYFEDSSQYRRAYTSDFEIYDKRSYMEPPEVEIHIAIE